MACWRAACLISTALPVDKTKNRARPCRQNTMAHKLPFPDRFYAAVAFAANPPLGSRAVSDETRLLLYALYQQVKSTAAAESYSRIPPTVEWPN